MSGRYRSDENILLTKHVVADGKFAKDAGSTPAASTIFPAGKNGAAPKPAFEAKAGPVFESFRPSAFAKKRL